MNGKRFFIMATRSVMAGIRPRGTYVRRTTQRRHCGLGRPRASSKSLLGVVRGFIVTVHQRTQQPQSTVLVFRKRLLAYSETFIAAQGRHLPHWRAVYIGLKADTSGCDMLSDKGNPTDPDDNVCLLHDHSCCPALSGALFKRCGVIPRRWLHQLQSHGPSILHAHFGPDALVALALKQRLGIPLVATFHGFDICIDTPRNGYRRRRHRIFEQADAVIAVSDFIAKRLADHGCPDTKIIRHNIGIDLQSFRCAYPQEGRQDVVFVGRLVEKKGAIDLLNAWSQIAARHPHHRLHIIGDGPQRQTLQHLAAPLGQAVVFHGRQNPQQVHDHLARAAVFCVPSVTSANGDAEGLGMVFLEAQAMATPVVSTRSGGIPEAVIDGHTGILVDERSPNALAEAIDDLLDNEPKRCALALAGPPHVAKQYDIRRQCAALESIYEAILARSTH